jgi:hypothetical protein
LNELVENVSVLVDSTPQPMLLTRNADDHLIQMPDIARARLLATEAPCILRTELLPPSPDRLVRYNDAAVEQHPSTSRRLRGNRKYNQTAWAMI